MTAYGAQVTATVEAWNRATLTDAIPGMQVRFMASSRSKGRIGAGQTAELVVEGLPEGKMDSVVVWMHSNAQSGAAIVSLQIGETTDTIATGSMKDWRGQSDYSTTDIAVRSTMQERTIHNGDSLKLMIEGSVNSVYLTGMDMYISAQALLPHTMKVHYISQTGKDSTIIMTESQAGEGIILPSTDGIYTDANGTSWRGIGWCEESWEVSETSPAHYWEAGDWYGPETDGDMYMLYTDQFPLVIPQTKQPVSGEYMIGGFWYDTTRLWCGKLANKHIQVMPAIIETEDNSYVAIVDSVDSRCRYTMEFSADSVRIAGVVPPGHDKWAYRMTNNGSMYLYATWEHIVQPDVHLDYWRGQSLIPYTDIDTDLPSVMLANEKWQEDRTYWLLFKVDDVQQTEAHYTTFPEVTPLKEINTRTVSVSKVLINGQLRIHANGKHYTIYGNLL
ncbi:MAG: hypothetical protein MJZ48_01930 [Paludibacteraceae bacterium]|nr:hypothetical protein [Paludibacteraceae bacterium]